jgi:hypothetical protein
VTTKDSKSLDVSAFVKKLGAGSRRMTLHMKRIGTVTMLSIAIQIFFKLALVQAPPRPFARASQI